MVIVSFDPGFSGGIAVIYDKKVDVFTMPIIKTKKGGKNKTEYDYIAICDILDSIKKEFSCQNIESCIEKVSTRPQEGNVSAFNFGQGFGCLIGICTAIFGKVPEFIYPQSWKKSFSKEFETTAIKRLTQEIKSISDNIKKEKEKIKELNSLIKTIEDKERKKQYKKQVDIHKKQVANLTKDKNKTNNKKKYEAKIQSRNICKKLYPKLKKEFELVKDDGKSDALLIGLHYKKTLKNDK